MASPLLGPAGNVEFLLHARAERGSAPSEETFGQEIRKAVQQGGELRADG